MDVDAIEKRSADFPKISLNNRGCAAAFAARIAIKAAWTRIHGGDEHYAGWKAQGHAGPGDGYRRILKRLTKDLEDISWKFWKFVEKQDSIMGEADFARAGSAGATADQTRVGNRVVRRPERTSAQKAAVRRKHSRDAVDFRGLDRFFKRQWWKDAGEPFRQHGFA